MKLVTLISLLALVLCTAGCSASTHMGSTSIGLPSLNVGNYIHVNTPSANISH